MATLTADVLQIDGVRFPPIWLRDNCHCVECRDPATGQKLFGITDLPETLVVADIEERDDQVAVTFAGDGHRSVFSREWLRANQPGAGLGETGKQLWTASDLTDSFPRALGPLPG